MLELYAGRGQAKREEGNQTRPGVVAYAVRKHAELISFCCIKRYGSRQLIEDEMHNRPKPWTSGSAVAVE